MKILISIAAVIIGCGLIVAVMRKMKLKKITEPQSVCWLLAGGIIVFLGIVPQTIPFVASVLGVWYPPTVLIFIVIVLITFIVFHHTTEISQLVNKVNELSIHVTLLKHENEQLKEQLENEHVRGEKH